MEQLAALIQPMFIKTVLHIMIGSIFALTVPVFFILIIHKLRIERRERKLAELERSYTAALTEKLSNPQINIEKPSEPIEFEALGNALTDMGINISSPKSARLRIIARSTALDSYYQEVAASRSWTRRYGAIEKLGFLKFPELEPFFINILDKEKEPHVIAKTIWALSLIATAGDLPTINRFLIDPLFTSAKFKEYIYTNIIQAFRERGELPLFIKWMEELLENEELPLSLKKDIIEACGAESLTETAGIICTFVERYSDASDIKIACIRALENIGSDMACQIIHKGLQDQDWRVRAVAAKNAEICRQGSIPLMEQLLHDSNYHVRINAAQSLAKFGENGLAVLRHGTRSDDRFVRDITRFVLEEAGHA